MNQSSRGKCPKRIFCDGFGLRMLELKHLEKQNTGVRLKVQALMKGVSPVFNKEFGDEWKFNYPEISNSARETLTIRGSSVPEQLKSRAMQRITLVPGVELMLATKDEGQIYWTSIMIEE